MADSSKRKPQPGDRHKSGFNIRLPVEYKETLAAIKAKFGIPYTVYLCRLIERDCRRQGHRHPNLHPEV